jgi:hypothetical protein
MTEKRTGRSEIENPQPADPAVPSRSSRPSGSLARGSSTGVSPDVSAVSSPRMPSRAPISLFQLPDEERRQSAPEITEPRVEPPSERPYLIAVIVLLFAVVAVLAFLLLV